MPNNKRPGAYGRAWQKARRKALERAGRRCERCGAKGGRGRTKRLQAHHRLPLAEGGAPCELNNLEILYPDCHRAAHE